MSNSGEWNEKDAERNRKKIELCVKQLTTELNKYQQLLRDTKNIDMEQAESLATNIVQATIALERADARLQANNMFEIALSGEQQ